MFAPTLQFPLLPFGNAPYTLRVSVGIVCYLAKVRLYRDTTEIVLNSKAIGTDRTAHG